MSALALVIISSAVVGVYALGVLTGLALRNRDRRSPERKWLDERVRQAIARVRAAEERRKDGPS